MTYKIFFLISEGQIHFMEMKFPIESEESIVDLYKEFLQSHPKVRLAVVGRCLFIIFETHLRLRMIRRVWRALKLTEILILLCFVNNIIWLQLVLALCGIIFQLNKLLYLTKSHW